MTPWRESDTRLLLRLCVAAQCYRLEQRGSGPKTTATEIELSSKTRKMSIAGSRRPHSSIYFYNCLMSSRNLWLITRRLKEMAAE